MRRARPQDVGQIRDRASYLFVQHARVEQDQRSIQLLTPTGRVRVPAASLAVLMLGPGTSITHAAMRSLAECGCQVTWTYGDHRRTFAGAINSDQSARRAIHQARVVSDDRRRLRVARRMYVARFDRPLRADLTLEQVRGMEGVRVREAYRQASARTGVPWRGRSFGPSAADGQDAVNIALSAASEALYGVCHATVVHAGWVPHLGVVHTGTATSFVLDIADLYRAHTVIPAAFDVAAGFGLPGWSPDEVRKGARAVLRDRLVEHRVLSGLVKDVDEVMDFRRGQVDDEDPETEERLAGLTLWDPGGDIDAGRDHGES
ncbi:MAG: type I-E CRISPR-associated endonuclease Cas1e [Solirubrobacteraceae bacterium]